MSNSTKKHHDFRIIWWNILMRWGWIMSKMCKSMASSTAISINRNNKIHFINWNTFAKFIELELVAFYMITVLSQVHKMCVTCKFQLHLKAYASTSWTSNMIWYFYLFVWNSSVELFSYMYLRAFMEKNSSFTFKKWTLLSKDVVNKNASVSQKDMS